MLEIRKCTIYPNIHECCSGDITVPLETWHRKTVVCIQVYIEGNREKRQQQLTNSIFIQQQPRSPSCHPSLILQSSGIQAEPYKPIDLSLPLIANLYYPPSSRLWFEGLTFSGGEAERGRELQLADRSKDGFMSCLENGSSSLPHFYYPIRSDVMAIIHDSLSHSADLAANMNDDFKCLRLIGVKLL